MILKFNYFVFKKYYIQQIQLMFLCQNYYLLKSILGKLQIVIVYSFNY